MAGRAPDRSVPLAPGSISLRLYPHELPGEALVSELRHQAVLGERGGFDGIMTAEHHGGFRGYMPNPLLTAGFCLEATARIWGAPCPLLLPLRHWTHVVEDLAWLGLRFPGRVAGGFAAGGWEGDFQLAEIPYEENMSRFKAALPKVVAALRGKAEGLLANDQGVEVCATHPMPLVSAAMSPAACRRAAALGLGVLYDGLQKADRIRELTESYRDAGGTGRCILIRRVWVGAPPLENVDAQMEFYRSYTSEKTQSTWDDRDVVSGADGAEVAERLLELMEHGRCDTLNVRVHVHGVGPEPIRDQIERFGAETIPLLRKGLASLRE